MNLGLIRIAAPMALAACAFSQATPQLAQTTRDGRLAPLLANLGNLHSPVTTKSREAQRYFDQGLTLVYGFNHAEAVRSFREAARLDPNCAMAYWGQALALAPNINDPAIGPDREKQGYDAMQEALRRKARSSARERALVDALAQRFAAEAPQDRAPLNLAYAKAMTGVYKEFARDPDVAALYADAVMNTRPWDYWTKDSQPRPGIAEVRTALERAIRACPNHAGARHLYIHLMEASDEVDLAVPSADLLGGLVPAAGHLVHMPAHIYIRVGRYADAANANVKAIAADEDYITQCRAQGIYPAAYYPHNIHFLNAALMMDGRRTKAIDSARKVAAQHDHSAMHEPGFAFTHLLKTLPLLTMVRFGMWDDILREPEPPADQPFGIAMSHFARGFAHSAQGRSADAASELAALQKAAADPVLKDMKIFELNSLAQLGEIAAAMLEGEVAEKRGNGEAAIAAYTRAVEMEDSLLYSEPPDWPLPPRQYLGEAYLAAGRSKEAERTYREDLKRHRANGWSLHGLEKALRAQGKVAEADEVHRRFERAWQRAGLPLQASRF